MPLDMSRYAVQDRPAADPLNAAMDDALTVFAATGRADWIAVEATADWFDPPRKRLIRRWYLWAWSTREAPHHVEHFRALLKNAIDRYRALRVLKATGGDRPTAAE